MVEAEAEAEAEAAGRKRTQELARSSREPPVHYIQREGNRPTDAPLPPAPVPVVDLRHLFQPDHSGNDEAEKLRSALQTWGLFQVIGHDMPASFLDEVHNIAKKFFQLPMEVKEKYNLRDGNEYREGYGNERVVTKGQILDWADRLYLLVQPEDERKMDLWPEEPNSFRDVLHEYNTKSSKVAKHVLRSMAKLLELDEDYFINQFGDKAEVYAKFNYFPCCSRPDLVFGLKPHSDGSVFTILLPDKEVEGLQVLKDGEWMKVSAIPHSLVIILGDEMEIMSNGIFKSPVHRVVTNPEMERISVALFYPLKQETELKAADGLVDEMRPRLYKTMKTRDYLKVFYQYFGQGERAIDWAKI